MTPQIAQAALMFLDRTHMSPAERVAFGQVEASLMAICNGQLVVAPPPEPEQPPVPPAAIAEEQNMFKRESTPELRDNEKDQIPERQKVA